MRLALALLAAAPGLAQAAALRVTLEVDGADVTVLSAVPVPGDVPSAPGELRVLDADGQVLATAALPPLPMRRAVITPDGHAGGTRASRLVRAELPWPDGAVGLGLAGRALPLPDAPPAAAWARNPTLPVAAAPVALAEHGPPDRRLDLLIVADGFTEADHDRFDAKVRELARYLARTEPFDAYGDLLNVWVQWTPSAASGIGQADEAPNDTPFGCYHGCEGVDRLICCDEEGILDHVAAEAPYADGVLVLADSDRYGGSGGYNYAVASVGPNGVEVAAHELAHTLVLLWDEYSYGVEGDPDAYISPNCAPAGEPVPWAAWVGDDHPEIGAYPGCSFTNWVSPTAFGCRMGDVFQPYCAVCREHLVRSLYGVLRGHLAEQVSPPPRTEIAACAGESVTFTVDAWEPPAGLRWRWILDGDVVSETPGHFTLDGADAVNGTLTLELSDPTPWVRHDPLQVTRQLLQWPVRARCGDAPRGCAAIPAPTTLGLLGAAALLGRRRTGRR